jgi:hypothetical protein
MMDKGSYCLKECGTDFWQRCQLFGGWFSACGL